MSAADVVTSIPITQVYRSLGGGVVRHGRARAFWRDGDGHSVSLNDSRGVWCDHKDNVGGGVLDLVAHVHGGSRFDALKWLCDINGLPLEDRPLDPAVKAEWEARQRDLPAAQLLRRAMLDLCEDLLVSLKTGLFDPKSPQPRPGEILSLETFKITIREAGEAAIVAEYRMWREKSPGMTNAMIRAARRLEQAEERALRRFIGLSDKQQGAATA